MDKVLIGLGILFISIFVAAAVQATSQTTIFSPFHNSEEPVTSADDTQSTGFMRGGVCHGSAWNEEEDFYRHHHKHWLDDSQVSNDHVHTYMHLTEEAQKAIELEYAREIGALDLDSFEDEDALREALEDIRDEIMASYLQGDADE